MANLFSPNKFLSDLGGNLQPAKSSLYNVKIFLPPIFATLPKKQSIESLSMLCESAEMPGKSFTTENVRIYGPGYNVPYLTTYQTIALTFLCTNIHTERLIFDLWMDSIINPVTNNVRFQQGRSNGNGYICPIQIVQYDLQEKEIYKVELIDSFPTSIAPQQLAWQDDGFQRLSVNFLYQKYRVMELNTGA